MPDSLLEAVTLCEVLNMALSLMSVHMQAEMLHLAQWAVLQ